MKALRSIQLRNTPETHVAFDCGCRLQYETPKDGFVVRNVGLMYMCQDCVVEEPVLKALSIECALFPNSKENESVESQEVLRGAIINYQNELARDKQVNRLK